LADAMRGSLIMLASAPLPSAEQQGAPLKWGY
jgi:hypothetical protein